MLAEIHGRGDAMGKVSNNTSDAMERGHLTNGIIGEDNAEETNPVPEDCCRPAVSTVICLTKPSMWGIVPRIIKPPGRWASLQSE